MPDVLTRSGWNLSAKTPKAARRQKKGSKAAEEKSDSVPYEPVPAGPPEDKENTNDAPAAAADTAVDPAADSEVIFLKQSKKWEYGIRNSLILLTEAVG